jgi:hypothetical protein
MKKDVDGNQTDGYLLRVSQPQNKMNERIHAARQVNQDRAADRQWVRELGMPNRDEIFTKFIGQLNRNGQTVHYINLRNGKTKEGHPSTLIDYLFRNQYV